MSKSKICADHVAFKKRNTGVLKASLFGADGARRVLKQKMDKSIRAEIKQDLKNHLIEARQAKRAIGDNTTFLNMRGCKRHKV